ncbi:MAG: hypothetical protein WBW98_03490, partial [Candidatus Sulfotelmatobacter sp.]
GISKDYNTLEEATTNEGNLWHYNYQLPDDKGKKLDLRDSYEFVTPEKRITRIEISADGGQHWTLLSESVATKVHQFWCRRDFWCRRATFLVHP